MGIAFYYEDLLHLGWVGDLFPAADTVAHEHFLRLDGAAYDDLRLVLSAVVGKLVTDVEMALAQQFLDTLDKPEVGTIEVPVDDVEDVADGLG